MTRESTPSPSGIAYSGEVGAPASAPSGTVDAALAGALLDVVNCGTARESDPAPIRASYHYLETGEWVTEAATRETMAQALEDVRQQVALIVAEREYPASPGPLCGYCDFLEICPQGRGFVESQPATLEGEPPWE